jgi:hypothetical protein
MKKEENGLSQTHEKTKSTRQEEQSQKKKQLTGIP